MQTTSSTQCKLCFKCGAEKPLTEFYKHKGMADGHLNKCKACAKNDVAKHREYNLEDIRAYDRKRGARQPKEYLPEWRKANPNKYKAHTMVNNAIRDGKIVKGDCEVCGSSKSVAHHDDYAFPMKVRWLCQAHHKIWHSVNGEAPNGK